MAARGQRIRRCQELPEDAFGDPAKAEHLIVVSHRWLDKHTCDVLTEEHPCGLKLQSLLQRMEGCFSAQAVCDGSYTANWSLAARLHAAFCVGGWDALVFFDFMSVPQDGLDCSGSVLNRTEDELAVFKECLPNMGTLYSRFPVLALPDVPNGDTSHEYFKSGWCVCEFSIAVLGKQLHQYSSQLLEAQTGAKRALIDCGSRRMSKVEAEKFQECIASELSALNFTHENDRAVAKSVVKGFLSQRIDADSGVCVRPRRLLRRRRTV